MRSLWGMIALTLVALGGAGCGADETASCEGPIAESNASFSVVSVSPSQIPSHDAVLTLHLEGTLPALGDHELEFFEVKILTGDPPTEDAGDYILPRGPDGGLLAEVTLGPMRFSKMKGPFSVAIVRTVEDSEGGVTETTATLQCAGTIVPRPASAKLTEQPGTGDLEVPIPAEIASKVTRYDSFLLESVGDEPLSIRAVRVEGASAFTAEANAKTCPQELVFGKVCNIGVRFSGTEPGPYDGQLVIDSNVAIAPIPLHAEILPPVDGIDQTFPVFIAATASQAFYTEPRQSVSLWDNDTIALSEHVGVQRIDQDGTLTTLQDREISSLSRDSVTPSAYGTTFEQTGELVRFDRDGAIDAIFAIPYGLVGPKVVVQSSGRVLAFDGGSVLALQRGGSVDLSYGEQGRVYVASPKRDSVLDATDRLYAHAGNSLVRLSADGVPEPLDPGLTVVAMAVDPQGRVVVSDGSSFVRYDLAAGHQALAINGASGVTHMVYDSTGRLYFDHAQGVLSTRVLPNGSQELVPHLGADDDVKPYAMYVTCPPKGACWVSGTTGRESYIARLDN